MLSIALWLEAHMVPCAYKSLFGVECPGCGMQRSLVQLLKGNVRESFALYPPLLFIMLLMTLFFVRLVNKNAIGKRFFSAYSWIVLAVVGISYVIRITGT